MIDADGWAAGARRVPSPNCDERPAGVAIDLLVIHNISLPPGEFGGSCVEQLFTNTLDCMSHPFFAALVGLRVSAHFFIDRNGVLVQFVPVTLRAWHAGASHWRGRERCNDFSIGIELEGVDDLDYADRQYVAAARLARALRNTFPIRSIAGHDQIATGRKSDPGPAFDWSRFLVALAAD